MSSWRFEALLQTEPALIIAPLSCFGLWILVLRVDFCWSVPAAEATDTRLFLEDPSHAVVLAAEVTTNHIASCPSAYF